MMAAEGVARRAAPQRAVMPAHAGIHYAAAVRIYRQRPGILDRPVKPGDDGWECGASWRDRFTFQIAKIVIRYRHCELLRSNPCREERVDCFVASYRRSN
jgi:hypothetical protein